MPLESPQTPIPLENKEVELSTAPLAQVRELLKAILLTAAVSTSPIHAEGSSVENVEKAHLEIPLEVTEGTKERFGISIEDACKKAGCEVVFEKPSKNGEYIIHVGQVHARPVEEFMVAPSFAQKVLKSQSAIYNLISELDKPFVVDEAGGPNGALLFQPHVSLETIATYHQEIFTSVETNSLGAICNWQFGERELINYLISKNNLDLSYISEVYNSQPQGKLFFDTFQKMSPWAIKQMIKENKPGLTSAEIDRDSQAILEMRKMGTTYHSYSLPFRTMEDKALFAIGAVNKLYFDGKEMTIVSGYDQELSIAATNSSGDSKKFEVAQNKRDDFAVSQATQTNQHFPLIVFGSMHSFINNKTDYGVIRVQTSFDSYSKSQEGNEDFDDKTPQVK